MYYVYVNDVLVSIEANAFNVLPVVVNRLAVYHHVVDNMCKNHGKDLDVVVRVEFRAAKHS